MTPGLLGQALPVHAITTAGPAPLAWGSDQYGQTGLPASTYGPESPHVVGGINDVTAVAAGSEHSLALRADGTVWAWGSDASGELGDGATTDSSSPVRTVGLPAVTAIAAGNGFSLALTSDGAVWGWGDDTSGELGDNHVRTISAVPVQAIGLPQVVAIAVGSGTSLALAADGTVWAWGAGPCVNSAEPVQLHLAGLTGIVAIAAGGDHALAIGPGGSLWAWGDNGFGDLGNGGAAADCSSAVQPIGLSGAVAISAGTYHSVRPRG